MAVLTCYDRVSSFGTSDFYQLWPSQYPHAIEATTSVSWVTPYTQLTHITVAHSLFLIRPVACVLHQHKAFNVFYNVLNTFTRRRPVVYKLRNAVHKYACNVSRMYATQSSYQDNVVILPS